MHSIFSSKIESLNNFTFLESLSCLNMQLTDTDLKAFHSVPRKRTPNLYIASIICNCLRRTFWINFLNFSVVHKYSPFRTYTLNLRFIAEKDAFSTAFSQMINAKYFFWRTVFFYSTVQKAGHHWVASSQTYFTLFLFGPIFRLSSQKDLFYFFSPYFCPSEWCNFATADWFFLFFLHNVSFFFNWTMNHSTHNKY